MVHGAQYDVEHTKVHERDARRYNSFREISPGETLSSHGMSLGLDMRRINHGSFLFLQARPRSKWLFLGEPPADQTSPSPLPGEPGFAEMGVDGPMTTACKIISTVKIPVDCRAEKPALANHLSSPPAS